MSAAVKTRVAVAGCGHWGRNHVRTLAEMGVLGAVCDADAVAARQQAVAHGISAISWPELLEDDSLAGVVIATPATTHAAMAEAAMRAGKHVLVEKPLSLTLSDSRRLADLAEASDRVMLVGHVLLYHPAFEALLGLVRSGALGVVRNAWASRLSFGRVRDEEDVLWSFAPHDLSMLIEVFGSEPTAVRGSDHHLLGSDRPADVARLDLAFGPGRAAHVFVSWLSPYRERRLTVLGDAGAAVFDDLAPAGEKLQWWARSGPESSADATPMQGPPTLVDVTEAQPLTRQALHFLDLIEGRVTEARAGPRQALAVQRVLEAARSGKERA